MTEYTEGPLGRYNNMINAWTQLDMQINGFCKGERTEEEVKEHFRYFFEGRSGLPKKTKSVSRVVYLALEQNFPDKPITLADYADPEITRALLVKRLTPVMIDAYRQVDILAEECNDFIRKVACKGVPMPWEEQRGRTAERFYWGDEPNHFDRHVLPKRE